jgi:diadenylate cyclase
LCTTNAHTLKKGVCPIDWWKQWTWIQALKEIADIAIVSYIVYKVLVLVRGTRAVQLLRGMIVLLAVWLLSQVLQLQTLQWLMNQMFTFGVLAVLIIFQPELRRALERLGRGKLFVLQSGEEDQVVMARVSMIARVVRQLSVQKIGMLLAFERETGLSEYVESGVLLQAKLSPQLLQHVFLPNTPLHDGAVIVSGDTIVAAGCTFPLSENPFLRKELGTRHKAALGISESSDALCVVVSEETGRVSLCEHGVLTEAVDDEHVITRLFAALRSRARNNAKRRRIWFLHKKEGHNG